MMPAALPTRGQAYVACVVAGFTTLASFALLTAAFALHAPLVVVPLIAVACIGCPMIHAWSLPTALAIIRSTGSSAEARALRSMRRNLDRLPETKHPLGL